MPIKNLKDLFIEQLQDAYSAESQLIEALPKMAEAASNPELRAGLTQHLRETEGQVRRLEQVAEMVGCEVDENTCEAMKGLVAEGEEIIDLNAEPDARDAGLIAAAQKVEHYEIATYGTLCAWAGQLGLTREKTLLGQTLTEEKAADQTLTRLAESIVNRQAAAH
jgi:ferritin-like metal-binding protein YciE